MGSNPATPPAETLVQLLLRTRQSDALIRRDEDWRVLGSIAARMLFWSGGAIYGCRCEANEMRFALQVQHASLGTVAHQLAGAYATYLRKTRHISGPIFKHYLVIPLHDAMFLDDLVFWLHRSQAPLANRSAAYTPVWTAENAYLVPGSLAWIDTRRVLGALSYGPAGPVTYQRRKIEPMSREVVDFFVRRPQRARAQGAHPNIEKIARLVADYCEVSYEDMLAGTRKRAVSKARVIATVLATRNGATAAAAARHFNRSRSTLIEQVEHYRVTQSEIFAEAESRLEALLVDARE